MRRLVLPAVQARLAQPAKGVLAGAGGPYGPLGAASRWRSSPKVLEEPRVPVAVPRRCLWLAGAQYWLAGVQNDAITHSATLSQL